MDKVKLEQEINDMKEQVINWRRHFHRHPELSFKEVQTSQYIYELLESFGNLEISRPTETSVVAKLIGGKPGKTLAIRADIDALPIEEENTFEFVSQNNGVMHACGHDGHTAMLLGTAKILSQYKEEISGEVRFIFEHAEEAFPGGAFELVQAGVMEGVDYVIGAHLMSMVESGKVGITYGPMTAAADGFWITIKGKGGHGGMPHETVDSIVIGAQVVTNLQQIVSRNVDPLDSVVVSIGNFVAEGAGNVIADTVQMNGIVRTFNPEYRDLAQEKIEKIVKGITEAHGADYTIDYKRGYPSIDNEEYVTKVLEETICEQFEEGTLSIIKPTMGAESFSYYSQEAPGTYINIGTRNEEKGSIYPHHHPKFTIDEDSLQYGIRTFVHAVFKFLG